MKQPNIEPTIKRSVAARLLNVCPKTLRNRELEGVLTPIRRNSRSVFYLESEVEKLQRGENPTKTPAIPQLAPARGATGRFEKAA